MASTRLSVHLPAAAIVLLLDAFVGCKERRPTAAHSTASSAGGSAESTRPAPAPSTTAASGAAPNTANVIPPTFATLKLVLTGTHPPCNAADCHGPGGPNPLQYWVKDDDKLYDTLTHHVSVDCGNIPVVTPGHPSQSAIVKVLKGPCSAKVPQMPNGCTPEANNCLPPEYVAAIERWIALGAPKK